MDLIALYESLPEIENITAEQRSMLESLMSLESPIDFNDDFATDEEMDALENALDQMEREVPFQIRFKEFVRRARAVASSSDDFI